jgi:phage terminase small subunit
MRTADQVERLAQAYVAGSTKKAAMILGGYAPRWAATNSSRVFKNPGIWRHHLFAFGLAYGLSHAEAARRAGYSPRSCATNASRLMKYKDVQETWREIVLRASGYE